MLVTFWRSSVRGEIRAWRLFIRRFRLFNDVVSVVRSLEGFGGGMKTREGRWGGLGDGWGCEGGLQWRGLDFTAEA